MAFSRWRNIYSFAHFDPVQISVRRSQTSTRLVTSTALIIGVLFGKVCEEKMFGMLKSASHSILRRNS